MKFPMRKVHFYYELVRAGDYLLADRSEWDPRRALGTRYPVIVCPRCLRASSCSDHTMVQERPLTIRASFLCGWSHPDDPSRKCGWHGWVTDGEMIEA